MALDPVEIDPRGPRDARLPEEGFAERHGIVGELADIGIVVEGALARRPDKAEPAQAGAQHVTVAQIGLPLRIAVVHGAERRRRRDLAEGRGRDEKVLLQHFGRAHEGLGQHHPADAPAGHAVEFGKRIDDNGVVGVFEGARRRPDIADAVIDLVRDQPYAQFRADICDRKECLAAECRPGRIGGRGQQQPVEGRLRIGFTHLIGRQLPAIPGRNRDFDRLKPDAVDGVEIGRIAGPREGDAPARREPGEKGEQKPGRGAGRDDDPVRIETNAVPLEIVVCERCPERRDALGLGIALRIVEHRPDRLPDFGGRRRPRFAGREMDDMPPSCFQRLGFGEDFHDMEGLQAGHIAVSHQIVQLPTHGNVFAKWGPAFRFEHATTRESDLAGRRIGFGKN